MQFELGKVYHVYNRGNDKQRIFFTDKNYIFFLKKIRTYISPHCIIMAYCLIPNHFHLLIYADERTVKPVGHKGVIKKNALCEGIRMLLSSYSKAINKQESRTGSLFQQQTKAKLVPVTDVDGRRIPYSKYCFHYIHQNPIKADLVKQLEDWPYCSFPDYAGKRNGTLCNKDFAISLLGLSTDHFYRESYESIEIEIAEELL
jgi:putative transposase